MTTSATAPAGSSALEVPRFSVPPFAGPSTPGVRPAPTVPLRLAGPYVPAAWRSSASPSALPTPVMAHHTRPTPSFLTSVVAPLAPTPVMPTASILTPGASTPPVSETSWDAMAGSMSDALPSISAFLRDELSIEDVFAADHESATSVPVAVATDAATDAPTDAPTDVAAEETAPWIEHFLANTPIVPMQAISGPPDVYRFATPASSMSVQAPADDGDVDLTRDLAGTFASDVSTDLASEFADEFSVILTNGDRRDPATYAMPDVAGEPADDPTREPVSERVSDPATDVVGDRFVDVVPVVHHLDFPTPPMGTPISTSTETRQTTPTPAPPFASIPTPVTPRTAIDTPLESSAYVAMEVPTFVAPSVSPLAPPAVPPYVPPTGSPTPMETGAIDPWPLYEAADALDAISRQLGQREESATPAQLFAEVPSPLPLPAWGDEDMMDLMPMRHATPAVAAGAETTAVESLDASAMAAEASAQAAAQALEMLAQRVRAGELQLPGYDPRMGDAAALVSALAALLGLRLG